MTVADDLATLREGLDYLWGDEVKENAAYDALDRLEAQLLSFREVAIARTSSTEALRQRAEAAEAEIAELKQSIKTIIKEDGVVVSRQAKELARLKDGLRTIAEHPAATYGSEHVYTISDFARALLAEHGASREDYEACCDHDRIVGRDVICELPAGHDGEHRMGGARWLRAEDGAARAAFHDTRREDFEREHMAEDGAASRLEQFETAIGREATTAERRLLAEDGAATNSEGQANQEHLSSAKAAGLPGPEDGAATEPNRVLLDAADQEGLRKMGAPVRCCGEWPECSHMLAFIEKRGGAA